MSDTTFKIILEAQDKASQAFKNLDGELVQVEQHAGKAGFAFDSMAMKIGAAVAAAAGVTIIANKLKDLALAAIDVGSQFEAFEVRLNAVTGGRGKQTLDELNEWAKTMPVNTQKAIDTFVMLKAMGLDPTMETMTTLSDVAVNFGDDALPRIGRSLGQIATLGKLSAEELNQLAEVGVNARKYLTEAFGMTVEELQKSGTDIQDIISAIIAGMEREFGGSSAQAMKNYTGLIEALKSEWTDFLKTVADAGVLDFAKEQLQGIVDEIERMKADGSLKQLAKDLADAIVAIGKFAGMLLDGVVALSRFTLENKELVTSIIGAGGLIAGVKGLSAAFGTLSTAAAAAGGASGGIGILRAAIAGPLGLAAAGGFAVSQILKLIGIIKEIERLKAVAITMEGVKMETDILAMSYQKLIDAVQAGTLTWEEARKVVGLTENVYDEFAEAAGRVQKAAEEAAKALGVDNWKPVSEQIKDIIVNFNLLKATELAKGKDADLELLEQAAKNAAGQILKLGEEGQEALDGLHVPGEIKAELDELGKAFDALGVTSGEEMRTEAQKMIDAYRDIATSADASAADQQRALDALVDHMMEVRDEAPEIFQEMYDSLPDAAKDGVDKAIRELGKLESAAKKTKEKVDSTFRSTGGTSSTSVTRGGYDGGTIVRTMAEGGIAFKRLPSAFINSGRGGVDDVPALLMRGEYVLKQSAVQRYGLDFLNRLNSGAISMDVIPRFASGGFVMPTQYMDLIPRFAGGGLAGDAAKRIEDVAAEVMEEVQKRIGLDKLKAAPQDSLDAILTTFSSSVRAFATGGNLTAADSELVAQKNLLKQEYQARISAAKAMGNEEIAYLWESMLLTLENLIEELREALNDMAEDFKIAMEDAELDYQDKLQDIQDKQNDAFKDVSGKKVSEEDKGEPIRSPFTGGIIAYRKEGEVLSPFTLQPIGGTGSSPGIRGSGDVGVRGVGILGRSMGVSADTTLEGFNEYASELRSLANERQRADEDYTREMEREESRAKREMQREGNRTLRDSRRERLDGGHDIRMTFLDYQQEIQQLETEMAKEIAELERKYTTVGISGFSRWLNFAAGGLVPSHLGVAGRDSVPAMLMPGEGILTTAAVDAIGADMVARLNSLDGRLLRNMRGVMRFADGGVVPGSKQSGASGDWGTISFNVGGQSYPAMMERDVAAALRNVLSKQSRSAR